MHVDPSSYHHPFSMSWEGRMEENIRDGFVRGRKRQERPGRASSNSDLEDVHPEPHLPNGEGALSWRSKES